MHESLEREMQIAGDRAEYDEHAKRILAHKIVLAHILVNSVPEFIGMKPEDVVNLIEGEPEVASVSVYPGMTNGSVYRKDGYNAPVITGSTTENKIPNEGTVTYDVRFFVWAPDKKEKMKIIVDAEMQRDFYPGYDIVTRGVFYAARLLSAQLDTEFDAEHYNDIKKVYSIWLCMDTPRRLHNTITYVHLEKETIGGPPVELGRYDLLGVIIVGLSGKLADEGDGLRLHRFLGTIFSEGLSVETKKEILAREYGLVMPKEMERRSEAMCNLGEAIEARGEKRGEKRVLMLCAKMQEDNRMEEYLKAVKDEAHLYKLYEEYGL